MTITQRRVRELLHYNPWTGVLTWRHVKNATPQWNGKYAGRTASYINKFGYVEIGIDGKTYRAHRVIWLYMFGYMPDEVDHQNHVKNDNKLENLRDTDRFGNCQNLSLSKNNTSGQIGVHWNKQRSMWYARIMAEGKRIDIGHFKDINEAIFARRAAEEKYGFHKNHGERRAA